MTSKLHGRITFYCKDITYCIAIMKADVEIMLLDLLHGGDGSPSTVAQLSGRKTV